MVRGTIYLEADADGDGWFTIAVPVATQAFSATGPTDEAVASLASLAWGHVDLRTLVARELGHVLAQSDDSVDGLMGQFLQSGVRRLPSAAYRPA